MCKILKIVQKDKGYTYICTSHIYMHIKKEKEKEIKRDNKKRIIENVIIKRFTYF